MKSAPPNAAAPNKIQSTRKQPNFGLENDLGILFKMKLAFGKDWC
jgi:hypothetical protein